MKWYIRLSAIDILQKTEKKASNKVIEGGW